MPQDRFLERSPTDWSARRRFERLNDNLRTALLILAGLIILSSVVMAWMIFSYIFDLATHPLKAKELLDQWAGLFVERTESRIPFLPTFEAPGQMLAVVTLGVLAFLLTRMPLLFLQMGTQILSACQDDRRLQKVLRDPSRPNSTTYRDYDS